MKKLALACILLYCFNPPSTLGQSTRHYSLKGTIAAIDSLHKRIPPEKVYLHLDKPYYSVGDTIRFKAYLLDEALYGSTKSGVLYVELINDSSRVIKRQMILADNGITRGDIVIKNNWYAGDYTLRAYTNWMRNFGPEHFFTRKVSIVAGSKHWLVNNRVSIDQGKNVSLELNFSDLAKRGIGLRDMQLRVLQGERTLLKQAVKTSPMGRVEIRFPLPVKRPGEPLSVFVEDVGKDGSGTKTGIPIQLNQPEDTDLQFMPEGGALVAGITSHVGFKAIGEDGKGINITGSIFNSKQQQVAAFTSTHKGMGSFELTPQAGESYTAQVTLPGGGSRTYSLAVIDSSGITMRVKTDKDSLELVLSASADLLTSTATYYLIGQARDKVCYGAAISFKDGIISKKIATSVFPTGIVKFVLLETNGRPISQRMVFIDHDDRLDISLNTDKTMYALRDSVGLLLTVKDAAGNPVQGSFSMTVTDDSQVKPFDADDENITSYMLLNPDLKGNIEQAGYYFNKENKDRAETLDNLLLTQGWTDYDWKPAFEPKAPEYEAEKEFTVKGAATNIFKKPLANSEIWLISTHPDLLLSAKTDTNGRFRFKDFSFLDTINFHFQSTRNKNIGLAIDEFIPPGFAPAKYRTIPWYVNSDSTLINYAVKKQAQRDEAFDAGKSKLLKTVVINDNRYQKRDPPYLSLNEEEIRNARPDPKPMTVWDLLNQREQLGHMDKTMIVDGELLTHEGMRPPFPFPTPATNADIAGWLQGYTVEDINSISARKIYTGKKQYGGVGLLITIKTNIKMGDITPHAGAYAYRPMPISWPHKFYSPRYTAKIPATVKDNRSTIYWAPDIITDVNGKAAGSFFTADIPGTYSIIVEGSDLNGNIGYLKKQITIGSSPATK